MPKHSMTKSDSSRIQSSQAKRGGNMSSGGFAARAQSAGDKWAGTNKGSSGYTSYTASSSRGSGGGGSGGYGSCCVM
ncbi:hypothetical protein B0T20DRAFT_484062 [Sordaria brevicollis]|uniref:Uncharacterized protein n=1 Tax=Sordaria brevicollis TaxID=83679 RepID=A0AAE0NVE8_SORBR|nr:hypothetical protein B0T20DRAFT_484062 [Sordaria brevicollis]